MKNDINEVKTIDTVIKIVACSSSNGDVAQLPNQLPQLLCCIHITCIYVIAVDYMHAWKENAVTSTQWHIIEN